MGYHCQTGNGIDFSCVCLTINLLNVIMFIIKNVLYNIFVFHSLIITLFTLFHDQRYGTCNILYTDSQFCYPNKKLAI